MKQTYLLIIALFAISCSSDDSANESDSLEPSRLLKSIKSTADWTPYLMYSVYYYEEGKIIKANGSARTTRYQMEYDNGKVKRQYGSLFPDTSIEWMNDFSYNLNSYSYGIGEFDYNGNNISNIHFNINRTSNGKPLTITVNNWGTFSNGIWTYFYDNDGNLLEKTQTAEAVNNHYTYVFDNKINPLNILYKKYGYLLWDLDLFQEFASFDNSMFEHNITKIYKNGSLIYTATYQYDSEGYPISVVTWDNTVTPSYRDNVYVYEYLD